MEDLSNLKFYLKAPEHYSLREVLALLDKVRAKSIQDKSTFQSALYLLKNEDRRAMMEDRLKILDNSLRKVISYRNTLNQTAGAWLKAHGHYSEFQMTNNEFLVSFCLRYGLKIPTITEFDSCPCCKAKLKNNIPCKVDAYGHHFASGCMKDIKSNSGLSQGVQPHAIHDAIRTTLHRIAKHAMAKSIQEPTWLLYVEGAQNQLRADLAVNLLSSDFVNIIYAIDVAVTCPFDGAKAGVPKVTYNDNGGELPKDLHDRRANIRKADKISKYQETCRNKNITFVPFILYSTGKIHKNGISFLTKLANHAEEARGISATTLLKYYIKLLNVALIKQVARAVSLKTLECNFPSASGMNKAIRTGNLVALDMANPQLSVHHDPRADY